MILVLLTLLALDGGGNRTIEINPVRNRQPIQFKVHHMRPTLVVFNVEPQGKMIIGDESNWYITTPADGLPHHSFHVKPKNADSGNQGNAFLFFDGYPVEVTFESTSNLEEATSLVYVNVHGVGDSRFDFGSDQPVTLRHQGKPGARTTGRPKEDQTNSLILERFREKSTPYGLLRWSGGSQPKVIFVPNPGMAKLQSIEVVRGKGRLFSKNSLKYAHPLKSQAEPLSSGHLLYFSKIHLGKRESYYLRLFFDGSRRPVYLKLKGLK